MKFSKLKELISKYGIETLISGLEEAPTLPTPPQDIHGSRIEVKGFVDPFFMGSLKREGLIQFTAENLDQDKGVVNLQHQSFIVTPEQAEKIVAENFGAIILHDRYFNLLSQEEMQKRIEYKKLCAEYDKYDDEYCRVDNQIKVRAYQEATE